MEENITDQLLRLIEGKTGTLTKVQLHSDSAVDVGAGATGTLYIQMYNDEPMVLCLSIDKYLKTSPVQSIELVEPVDDKTRILFKTWTSTYEVLV